MAGRKVCFVLVDGARADVVRDLLERGDLPNLACHVVEPGGLTVGTSVFPSTTGVAYLPFLYGVYPGTANIPGIRWLDRAGATGDWRAQWRAARSYCGVQAGWLNRDLETGPSIFELVPESVALCTPLTNGLRPGACRLVATRMWLGSVAHYAGTYQGLDDAVGAVRAATMVSGNASVQVYFGPRSGRERPLMENELPADVLGHLLGLPAVRLAAWRDGRGGVTVAAGAARAQLRDDEGRIRYEPVTG